MFIMSDLPTSWRNHSNMEYRRRAININNHGSRDLSPQVKKKTKNIKTLELTTARGWTSFSLEELGSPLKP